MKNKNFIFIIGQISFVIGIVLIFLARNGDSNLTYFPASILLGLSIVFNTYSVTKRYFNK